jgi:hypothetical protein
MKADILTYEGSTDGLRFGHVRFPGNVRRWFVHDRLSGRVTLWREMRAASKAPFDDRSTFEDSDPDRKSAALEAVRQFQPKPVDTQAQAGGHAPPEPSAKSSVGYGAP